MRLIGNILMVIGLLLLAVVVDTELLPVLWNKMNDANTSFMANIYGAVAFISLIVANGPIILLSILKCEYHYKKSHTYNSARRKWEKKK